MKTNKFSVLQLNKKAIAKLNDAQLTSVKGGGNNANAELADCTAAGSITCSGAGSTIVVQTKVS